MEYRNLGTFSLYVYPYPLYSLLLTPDKHRERRGSGTGTIQAPEPRRNLPEPGIGTSRNLASPPGFPAPPQARVIAAGVTHSPLPGPLPSSAWPGFRRNLRPDRGRGAAGLLRATSGLGRVAELRPPGLIAAGARWRASAAALRIGAAAGPSSSG